MTREDLKRLIEPTQDGAKFDAVLPTDHLSQLVLKEIAAAETVSDVSNALQYAIDQLRSAQAAMSGNDDTLTDLD